MTTAMLTTAQVLATYHGVPACTDRELQHVFTAITGQPVRIEEVRYGAQLLRTYIAKVCPWVLEHDTPPQPTNGSYSTTALNEWVAAATQAHGDTHSVPLGDADPKQLDETLADASGRGPRERLAKLLAASREQHKVADMRRDEYMEGWEAGAEYAWQATSRAWNAEAARLSDSGDSFRGAYIFAANPVLQAAMEQVEDPESVHTVTVYPDSPDSFTWGCPGAPGCQGWHPCPEHHSSPFFEDVDKRGAQLLRAVGSDSYTFHDQEHFWRPGKGWGVVNGEICVAAELDLVLPDELFDDDADVRETETVEDSGDTYVPAGKRYPMRPGYHYLEVRWSDSETPEAEVIATLPIVGRRPKRFT